MEFSQQRKISQTERLHTKMLSIWKHMCMRVTFSMMKQVKSKNKSNGRRKTG